MSGCGKCYGDAMRSRGESPSVDVQEHAPDCPKGKRRFCEVRIRGRILSYDATRHDIILSVHDGPDGQPETLRSLPVDWFDFDEARSSEPGRKECDDGNGMRVVLDDKPIVDEPNDEGRRTELEATLTRDVVIEDSKGYAQGVLITDGKGNELRGVSAIRYEADVYSNGGRTSLTLELCPAIVATKLRARGFKAVVDVEELRNAFAVIAGDVLEGSP